MSNQYRFLVSASALGLAATATWHALTLLGISVPDEVGVTLFTAMFPLWFAAIISARGLRDRIAADRSRVWQIVLEGAPTWMRLMALGLFIYSLVNWELATGGFSRVTGHDPAFPRVGSAIAMVFFAAGMAMLYAAGARTQAVRCPEGHLIFPGQDFCRVCGQLPEKQPSTSMGHGA